MKKLFFFILITTFFIQLFGCTKDTTWYRIPNKETEDAIRPYVNNYMTERLKDAKGKIFTEYQTLGYEQQDNLYYVYTWIHSISYFKYNNQIVKEMDIEFPAKLLITKKNNHIEVNRLIEPREGKLVSTFIRSQFPKNIVNHLFKENTLKYELKNHIVDEVRMYYMMTPTDSFLSIDDLKISPTKKTVIEGKVTLEWNLPENTKDLEKMMIRRIEQNVKDTKEFELKANDHLYIDTDVKKGQIYTYEFYVYGYEKGPYKSDVVSIQIPSN